MIQLHFSSSCYAWPVLGHCQTRSACRWHAKTAVHAIPDYKNEFEGVGGNKDLQDALLQQLRVQVESETLKEEIKEDLKERVEGLKQIGEELLQRLDEELSIEKFRTDLESTQVLSEANEKFNELEEQLQQIKDQIKADQEDLRAFETASASARSQGLFFKNLYQPEPEEKDEQQQAEVSLPSSRKLSKPLLDPQAARAAAAEVASSAEEEVSSPFRMYLFGYMAAVLALVLVQDLSTPDPKYALDALYGVLGLLLGVNAYNERKALMKVLHKQRQQLQEGTAATGSSGSSSEQATASAVKPADGSNS